MPQAAIGVHTLCLSLLALALAGCSSTLQRLPPGQSLSIEVVPEVEGSVPPLAIVNRSTTPATSAGMAAGATAGAAAGVACGLLAPICVVAFGVAGGVAGSGTGALVGHALHAPRGERETVARVVEAQVRAFNPHEDMIAALEKQAKAQWQIVDKSPGATLRIHVDWIALSTAIDRDTALMLRALAVLKTPDAAETVEVFDYRSPRSDIARWTSEDFVRAAFRDGYEAIAARIVSSLTRAADF
jgi:hypothetical protein